MDAPKKVFIYDNILCVYPIQSFMNELNLVYILK